MKKYCLLLLLSSFLLANAINLDTAIKSSFKNYKQLKISKLDLENKKSQTIIDILSFSPDININSSFENIKNKRYPGSNNININQNISLFDNRFYKFSISNNNLKKAKVEFDKYKANLAYDVIQVYCDILLNKKQIEFYKSSVNRYTALLKLTCELCKVGKRTILDKTSTKLELENYKLLLNKHKNLLEKNILSFNRLTGLNVNNNQNFDDFKIEDINNKYNKQFYDYKIQQLTNKNYKLLKKQNFKNMFPQLNLSYQAYWQQNDEFKDGLKPLDNYIHNWQVKAFFSWDFGSLYSNLLKYKIANKNYLKTKLNLQDTKQQLNLKLSNLNLDINLKQTELKINKQRLQYAKTNNNLYKQRYQKGLISFVDFKTAYNDFLNTKLQLQQAKYEYILLIAERQKLCASKIFGKY